MNILITGCSRGIGYETALKLSEIEGIKVIATSRNAGELEKLRLESLKKNKSARILPVVFDLENGNIATLATLLKEEVGTLDILINNAALALVKPFEQVQEQDFEQVYRVNVFRPAMLIKAILPFMNGSGKYGAHIVNISSIGGLQGSVKFPGLSVYSSSKAALCGLTECLAVELKDKHVSVNALCLGGVNTEMLKQAFPGYTAPVEASDMGRYIAWFALNGHQFQNGHVIPVSLSTP
ncbi:MAG: SDR family NAD(P)-dependent oxidoreductase [Bacteroidia bacterium]